MIRPPEHPFVGRWKITTKWLREASPGFFLMAVRGKPAMYSGMVPERWWLFDNDNDVEEESAL